MSGHHDHDGLAGAALVVIDDEEQVRHLLRRTLESAGAMVFDADSGAAGLELVAQSPAPLDLVITDVRMRGITGVEVAQVLSIFRPDLPVLAISGYVDGTASDRRITLLPKPFTPAELLDAARGVIQRARSLRPAGRERRAAAGALREAVGTGSGLSADSAVHGSELVAAARALRRLNLGRATR